MLETGSRLAIIISYIVVKAFRPSLNRLSLNKMLLLGYRLLYISQKNL